jgi:bacteriocin biosynthesis cyclodehydratase domain-containing protein
LTDRAADLNTKTFLGVAEGLDLVLISDDEVLIQFGTRSRPSELLRDGDATGILGRVVGRLVQRPASVEELLFHAPPNHQADLRHLLIDLIDRGIVVDLRSSPIEQYLRYTFEGEPHAAKSRVVMIGAGPLGGRIAQTFLQHGIGKLALLDERPVDPLWDAFTPFGLTPGGDGRRADAVLRERLTVPVECLDAKLDSAGVELAVANSDFLVLALEQPDVRVAHLVNRFAIRDRKPWLLATIDGNLGLVGPLFHPVDTACYNDYQTLAVAATPSPAMARKHREHRLGGGVRSFFAGLPSYAEIVAGHASLAVVHFLLRGTCFALGRVMVIDFDRMRIDVEDVLKLPRCPVCGTQKSAYRPPFPA